MPEFTLREVPAGEAGPVSDQIEARLLEALAVTNTQSVNSGFTLACHGDDRTLLGGLTASTSYGWLLIKTLWVNEANRGTGLGRKLMLEAEARGRDLGCHAAWLDTSSSTAHGFYQRLGYKDFGTLRNEPGDIPKDHSRWFMMRRL